MCVLNAKTFQNHTIMFKTFLFDPATLQLPSFFENLRSSESRSITLEEMQQLSMSDTFLQRTTALARQALAENGQVPSDLL